MKAREFAIEAKKPKLTMPKQRDPNWQTMQAKGTSGASGRHQDKKKAAKQGQVKHKGRMDESNDQELYGLRIGDTVIAKINGQRVQGNIIDIFPEDMEVELMLRGPEAGRTVTVDVRDTEIIEDRNVSEDDKPDEQYLDKVISDLHKDAFGMRPDREFGQQWMSSSYEEKLQIYNNMLKNLHSDLDEGNIQQLRNNKGMTQQEWMDALKKQGGRIIAQAKMPNGNIIGELNGKRLTWVAVKPNQTAPQMAGNSTMKEDISDLEAQQEKLEYAFKQSQKITTAIKYEDTVSEIITNIQKLAEENGIADELKYPINDVYEAQAQLQSAVYGLEQVFEDALRQVRWKIEELEDEDYDRNN